MSLARSSLVRSIAQLGRRAPVTTSKAVVARYYATESKNLKREIISEKQVPVTAFKPDSANSTGSTTPHHFTIPVVASKPVAEPTEAVTPLTHAAYAQLPATLKKMTVFGKIVIVTG